VRAAWKRKREYLFVVLKELWFLAFGAAKHMTGCRQSLTDLEITANKGEPVTGHTTLLTKLKECQC
jgi:hypothetical protein